jgi:hypothetical protein
MLKARICVGVLRRTFVQPGDAAIIKNGLFFRLLNISFKFRVVRLNRLQPLAYERTQSFARIARLID